jgi:RNA polymerase sigma factor FliA
MSGRETGWCSRTCRWSSTSVYKKIRELPPSCEVDGAVLDELRRRDWAPRSLRRLERDMLRAQETFTGAHGRPPSRAELASMMSMSPAELSDKEYEIRRSDLTSLSSLAVTDGESGIQLIETLESDDLHADPEDRLAREEARGKFRRAFERRSPRERDSIRS